MAPPPPPPIAAATAPQTPLSAHERIEAEANETKRVPKIGEPLGKLTGVEEITQRFIDLLPEQHNRKYEHEDLLPDYPELDWAPLEDIDVPEDAGIRADPQYKALFAAATEVDHLTPGFGTVLYGVKLADLNDKQKNELARLVAFRGAVFFREQDDLDIQKLIKLGRYYGPLHRHATTPLPKGAAKDESLLDVHVVRATEKRFLTQSISQGRLWHSDVSYERQPPSYTFLQLLEGPPTGGDTLWSSGYNLYDRLSPNLQKYLETLTAVHSAHEQAEESRRGGHYVRRQPITTEHPIIRVNPVTGYRSVYVNAGFTRYIKGVPRDESDLILRHLFELTATDVNNTVRWRWKKNDVVVWDNRSTFHSASFGFWPHYRHVIRVTPHGEKPSGGEGRGKSQQETLQAKFDLPNIPRAETSTVLD